MFNNIHKVEIVLWMLIISILITGSVIYYKTLMEEKTYYSVEFSDIDGIEQGAPVNFMGVEVGSVAKFQQKGRRMIIYFNLYNPDFHFPRGSGVTIQFTGLVGSKTLEIEPARGPLYNKGPKFVPRDPIRISSFMEITAKSYQSVAQGSRNLLKILGGDNIPEIQLALGEINLFTYKALNKFSDITEVIVNLRKGFLASVDEITLALNNYIITTNRVNNALNSRDYDQETIALLNDVNYSMKLIYNSIIEKNYQRILDDFTYTVRSLNRRINKESISRIKNIKLSSYSKKLDDLGCALNKTDNILSNLYNALEPEKINKQIDAFIDALDEFSIQSKKWEQDI